MNNNSNISKEILIDIYAKAIATGDVPKEESPRIRNESSDDWYWTNGKSCANTNTKKKHSK